MPRLESQMACVSAWMQRDATGRNGAEEIIDSAGYVRATCPFETTTSLNTSISGEGRGHASKFTLNIPCGPIPIILRLWGFDTQTVSSGTAWASWSFSDCWHPCLAGSRRVSSVWIFCPFKGSDESQLIAKHFYSLLCGIQLLFYESWKW